MAAAAGALRGPRRRWWLCVCTLAAVIGVLHLVRVGSVPGGLYNDEASVGYNAWSIAHHGVDEHDVHLPLFFEAFGEWKNPIYIYLLAPLTWWLPLTATTERLPAALLSLVTVLAAGLTARRLGGSRWLGLLVAGFAGLTPWLVLGGRTALSGFTDVAPLAVALWCLVEGLTRRRGATPWFAAAGLALTVTLYAYTTERLLVSLLCGLLVAAWGGAWRRSRAPAAALVAPAAGYVLLLLWGRAHPGALTGRFDAVGILADHPSPPVAVARFLGNWLDYLGPRFLLLSGDANPRHNTGHQGMLLVTSAPLLVLGAVACARRLEEPLHRFLGGGLLLAAVPAALTQEGSPHALRSAAMLPFLFALIGLGAAELVRLAAGRAGLGRALLVAGLAALCMESGLYLSDLFGAYPARSAVAFDSGELEGVRAAHQLAGAGHRVLLSDSLDAPAIQALFALTPDPATANQDDLGALGMEVVPAQDLAGAARCGDALVAAPGDPLPGAATVVARPGPLVVVATLHPSGCS